MINLNFIFKSFEGKKSKIKIISATILTLFLFQAISMTNISDNNEISESNSINNDLIAPIEDLPTINENEILEIEEFTEDEIIIENF